VIFYGKLFFAPTEFSLIEETAAMKDTLNN
jgi:hypothetical protein